MIGFDLFCGGGLASRGIHENGIDMVGFDNNPIAKISYDMNFCGILSDIGQDEDRIIHALTGNEYIVGWASPPCTEHTGAKGSRPANEAVNDLAASAARIAAAVQPRFFIMENHVNLVKHPVFDKVCKILSPVYGQPQINVIDPHIHLGRPANRKRVFVIWGGGRLTYSLKPAAWWHGT